MNYFLKPGFNDDTVLYEIELKEVYRANGITIDDIDQVLDDYNVKRLVIDAGYPNIIERLRVKRMIHKLLRRKTKE